MALSDDEAFKVEIAIEGSKENPEALSDWETGFIISITDKYETYGRQAMISEKQWRFIDAIYDKVVPSK